MPKKAIITVLIISGTIVFMVKCTGNKAVKNNNLNKNEFAEFAGSSSCNACHADVYKSHLNTAHFSSSSIATEKTIKGGLAAGQNSYLFSNGSRVVMEKRNDSLAQVEYFRGEENRYHTFDIAIGSGTKGQSFLYWGGNKLFQLPITYFTPATQWTNSPGYPNKVMFQKPITARCLECHVTYAEKIAEPDKGQEEFSKNNIVFGIDCERCHGPAKKHVDFQTENPADKVGKYIVNPKNFTRQQQLDLCALCHAGGILKKTKPSFSYNSGESIADYFSWDTIASQTAYLDVHGNQYGLMMKSKCFTQTNTLTCNTCHSPHENQRDNTLLFSQKCMSCHQPGHSNFCTIKNVESAVLIKNCIDCHMPKLSSRSIVVQLQGQPAPEATRLNTHHITVYTEETKKVIEYLKNRKGI